MTPLDGQPVWCAGVTYEVSRDARILESDAPDHYARVYDADRPELFFKALPGEELVDWLFAAQEFPAQEFPFGVALLTGTALVPASEFTLAADDQVSISLTGLGRLDNVVEVVGLRSGQPT